MLAKAASKLKTGASPSDTPLAPIPALNPSAPAHADLRLKGVVERTTSEDEDTCLGLVFNRKKGADATVLAQSVSEGRASSFRENPPSASSPCDLVVHEGGGESAPRGDFGVPPAAELPAFLQEVLQTFQDREVDGQGEDPLGGHATRGLGTFLIASSRTSTQVQELRVEVLKLREAASQDVLQIKKLTQH